MPNIIPNVPSSVLSKLSRRLYLLPNHPLSIINSLISQYFSKHPHSFIPFSGLDPKVSVKQNFDDLDFPIDHPGRSLSDTYYLDKDTVLRTHMTAHELEFLRKGHRRFLLTGDVYRRDEIDDRHYPSFHQIEGVKVFSLQELSSLPHASQIDVSVNVQTQTPHNPQHVATVVSDLKTSLEGLALSLFGPNLDDMRWIDAYFPFTQPSYELEIKYRGRWLEVLGCGILQHSFLSKAALLPSSHMAWAFGLGLERLAMILFEIPDIRLFWSNDSRFTSQFTQGSITKFKPYSAYPHIARDLSAWINDFEDGDNHFGSRFHENDLHELVRSVAGDLAESVTKIDEFKNSEGRKSVCYRIMYRSMERSLTDDEINKLQMEIRSQCSSINLTVR